MKIVLILIVAVLLVSFFSCAYAQLPSPIKIKDLYADASGLSKVVYQIPIDVVLLDISPDSNWYKVSIAYNIGPARFKYSGWAYIPIGIVLAQKTK